jgi:hypothetical protein
MCPSPTGGRQSRHYVFILLIVDADLPHRSKMIVSLCHDCSDRRCVPPPPGEDDHVAMSWFYQSWMRPSPTVGRRSRCYKSYFWWRITMLEASIIITLALYCRVQAFLQEYKIELASIRQAKLHANIYGTHINIVPCLVPMRLGKSFAK